MEFITMKESYEQTVLDAIEPLLEEARDSLSNRDFTALCVELIKEIAESLYGV